MARDYYAEITETLVKQLEAGVPPWVRPWKQTLASTPHNGVSKRPYRGINALTLWCAQDANGWKTGDWYTFNAVGKAGGSVKSGQHGTPVVKWFFPDRSEAEDGEDEQTQSRRKPWCQWYIVFNRAQCLGLPEVVETDESEEFSPIAEAEHIVRSTGAKISHGGDRACYHIDDDRISLPEPESFKSPESYYATAFHELSHWTGADSRNKRSIKNLFGTDGYAVEELVAELSASYLCADVHVDSEMQNTASYLAHWAKVLKAQPRIILSIAAAARKAHDYVKGLADKATAATQVAA